MDLALRNGQVRVIDGGGQREALVDVELLVRRGIGGQHHAEQNAQCQHEAEHHPVQRALLPGEQPPAGPDENQRQQGNDPVEFGQKTADLSIYTQNGQHALGGLAVHGQPQTRFVCSGGVTDEQTALAGVVSGQSHPIVPLTKGGQLHRLGKPQRGVVGLGGVQNIAHVAFAGGQHLAGVQIGEGELQHTGGAFVARLLHLEGKAHVQQVPVADEILSHGIVDEGKLAELVIDHPAAAFFAVAPHLGEPDTGKDEKGHSQQRSAAQKAAVRFELREKFFHGKTLSVRAWPVIYLPDWP